MKYYVSLILFVLGVFTMLTSCGNNKEDNNTPQTPNTTIVFSGLTKTDASGAIYALDSTDWTITDKWQQKEIDLFPNTLSTGCTASALMTVATYPNPCNGVFSMALQKPKAARFSLRVVDEKFRVLLTKDTLSGDSYNFNTPTTLKDTVRVYYKFILNNCEYRGHGDILFQ